MTDLANLALIRELVKKQACFSKLTDKEIDALIDLFVEKHVTAGETIVTEGDPVDSVYLILGGTADVRHLTFPPNQPPKMESLATLGPNQAIGLNETGFYSLSGKRTATVVANTNMTLLQLSVAAFHGFALAHPHVNEVMRQYSANVT